MQIQQSAAPLRTGIQTDAARGSYTAQSRPEPARKNSSGDSIQRLHRAPAAGFRNASSGALLSVGERGYAWSSSTYGTDDPSAARLRFIADFVGPVHTDNRSYGFSVRCVQHLQGCLTGRSGRSCGGRRARKRPLLYGTEPGTGKGHSVAAGRACRPFVFESRCSVFRFRGCLRERFLAGSAGRLFCAPAVCRALSSAASESAAAWWEAVY